MKILQTEKNVAWLPQPNKVSFIVSREMPPPALCTSAYVFAFEGDALLMADLDRGVDIPGGHIDSGETPEAAMRRETKEETGATLGAVRMLGYQKITLKGPKPPGYKYPYPESYQIMYHATEVKPGEFSADEDSRGPVLISPEKAAKIPWLQKHRALYDYARAQCKTASAKEQTPKL